MATTERPYWSHYDGIALDPFLLGSLGFVRLHLPAPVGWVVCCWTSGTWLYWAAHGRTLLTAPLVAHFWGKLPIPALVDWALSGIHQRVGLSLWADLRRAGPEYWARE